MQKLLLFTDGSVNTKTKTGFGACLFVTNPYLPDEILKEHIKTKKFEGTSSTRLELETLLWALSEFNLEGKEVIVHTDSQNIAGLPQRRERLEKNGFRSKNHRLLSNHDLYREFFKAVDKLHCVFVKVTGHQPSRQKDNIHRLFTLVDKASRIALRSLEPS